MVEYAFAIEYDPPALTACEPPPSVYDHVERDTSDERGGLTFTADPGSPLITTDTPGAPLILIFDMINSFCVFAAPQKCCEIYICASYC
jgi:hypothetical protein